MINSTQILLCHTSKPSLFPKRKHHYSFSEYLSRSFSMHSLKHMVLFADIIQLSLTILYALLCNLLVFLNKMSWRSFHNFKFQISLAKVQEKRNPSPADECINWYIPLQQQFTVSTERCTYSVTQQFPCLVSVLEKYFYLYTRRHVQVFLSSFAVIGARLNQNIYSVEYSVAIKKN